MTIEDINRLLDENIGWIVALGLNLVYALAILVAALWIGGTVKRRIEALPKRNRRIDPTLTGFLGSFARYAVLAVAVVFILGRFGIQTTSLVALIGAAGLAIGLALQGTLSNLAAGVMLIGFRPFKVGDFIAAGGHSGTVAAITLFTTELTTPDNVQIIVPNSDIWSSPITNYSHHATRRCDLVFGVSYDSDLKRAEAVLRRCIDADRRVMADPEPFVKVTRLGEYAVEFTLRLWCDTDDFWELKFDLIRAVKEAFDAEGIEIPFPTQVEIARTG